MGKAERIARIRDNLAKIGLQDTKLVIETNVAMRRMADLGLHPIQVRGMLDGNPKAKIPLAAAADGDTPFFGFDSRAQASLAAWGGTRKSDRPGALGDVHDRVNTLMKNQEPERATGTLGLAIISIPAMTSLPAPVTEVKRMRRLPSGKLKELGAVIDVEEEVGESTITMKRER